MKQLNDFELLADLDSDDNWRVSYIILYKKDNAKYVFNRSVDWNTSFSKQLYNILKTIGYNIILDKIAEFMEKHNNVCMNISNIYDVLDENNCVILETRIDLPNFNLRDQQKLNKLKKEWCEKLGAVDRKDEIDFSNEDIFAIKSIESELWTYVDKIYCDILQTRKHNKDSYINMLRDVDAEYKKYKLEKEKELDQFIYEIERKKRKIISEYDNQLKTIAKMYKSAKCVLENKPESGNELLIRKIMNGEYYSMDNIKHKMYKNNLQGYERANF